MIAESITAGLGSLKAGFDLAKSFNAANSKAAINEAKIALQEHIMQGQQSLAAATDRIRELEQEIVRLEHWSAEKKNYELADTGQGSLAYKLKEGVQPPQPPHWICPQCYEDGKKSILKHETLQIGRAETLQCHRCGFDVVTQGVRHAQTPYAKVPTARSGFNKR